MTFTGSRSIGRSRQASFFSFLFPNSRHVPLFFLVYFRELTNWLDLAVFFFFFLACPQGSTYIYKTYLEPFLVQNESNIDAGLASARDETVQFIHSRLSALWDLLYSLLSKTPITPKMATPTNGSPLSSQKTPQAIQGLWGAIIPPPSLASSAIPSAPNGRPTISRSVSPTPAMETHAPSPPPSHASSSSAAGSAGYDVDETVDG